MRPPKPLREARAPKPPRTPGPLRMRRSRTRLVQVDDQLARGPLGVLRELPQIGFAAAGAVLVVGAFGALDIDATRTPAAGAAPTTGPPATAVAAGCPVGSASGTAYVGPAPGTAVPAYVTAQQQRLAACLRAAPSARLFAVVSLVVGESPTQAAEALRGVALEQVYVLLPAAASSPYVLPLAGATDGVVQVGQAIQAAYVQAEAAFATDRSQQLSQAATVAGTTPSAVAEQQDLRAAADQDELAAGELMRPCACAYGAVAFGTVRQLAALQTSDVKVVALAPAGAVADGLTARPLLPAETETLSTVAAPSAVVAGSLQ